MEEGHDAVFSMVVHQPGICRLRVSRSSGIQLDPDDLCRQVQLHLTSVVAALHGQRSGSSAISSSATILTAPTPDVRVRAHTSFVMLAQGLTTLLGVTVENYSPVVVHLQPISLDLADGTRMTGLQDAATGTRAGGTTRLEPGTSHSFFYSLDDIRKVRKTTVIVCAIARDAIGREYRSNQDDMVKVLKQLSGKLRDGEAQSVTKA
jgi:hypothetical protein